MAVAVSFSLDPETLAILDAYVARGDAKGRSEALRMAVKYSETCRVAVLDAELDKETHQTGMVLCQGCMETAGACACTHPVLGFCPREDSK